jgi:carboxyl-terminal processing protease
MDELFIDETQTQPQQTGQTDKSNQTKRRAFKVAALLLVFVVLFSAGYFTGRSGYIYENSEIRINKGPAKSADYNLLWEALDILNSKYVDKGNLDQKQLLYGAVAGLMQATGDPYTVFFDPEQAKEFNDQLKGSFDGIGAEVGMQDEQIVIVAPLPNTPAQRAGLLPKDAILSIDGASTIGMSVDEAVSRIRGKKGTEVVLLVGRKSSREPIEIQIIRDKIEVKSIKFETKEIDSRKIGVVIVSRFGDDTFGLFNEVVKVMLAGNYSGMVLDLRNNPGGYLETAVEMASMWVNMDTVVLNEKNYLGENKEYKSEGLPLLKDFKTVVLVNGGSASASEILAGALQDYKIAQLVGEKTFGKGSVQELIKMREDSELKVTVAKWYTPLGRSIDKDGLMPDVEIVPPEQDVSDLEKDAQLDKALEIITN